jgi:hypothetical protein
MSRGLGVLERAVAKAIARCRKDYGVDDIHVTLGMKPGPKPVMVTPRHVCMILCAIDGEKPSPTRLRAATRAMHSFVRKSPQYGLISGTGRGRLALYERGDELSAMWAKLNSQRQSLVTMTSAQAALDHLKSQRNEVFVIHNRRKLDFRITGAGRKDTRRRKQFFPSISLPIENEAKS